MKLLLLGLGNDLLSDDAVGILTVRELRKHLNGEVDVVESSQSGIALLELFLGYDRAIVIDAVQTTRHPPGTIHELSPADLDSVVAPSPHFAGLPEMLAIAKRLQLEFPKEIKIFAVEVEDPYTIGGEMSEAVRNAIPGLAQRVRTLIKMWQEEVCDARVFHT